MEIVQNLKNLAIKDSPLLKPAEKYRDREKGVSNMFLIEVEKDRKAFRYDIDIAQLGVDRAGKDFEKNLAKGSDEGLRARNRNLCYEILAVAYGLTGGFGILGVGDIIYDCKSTLYASMELKLNDRNVMVNNEHLNEFIRLYCGPEARFRVSIAANSSGHILDMTDITQYTSKNSLAREDRSLRTFLEMAMAQTSLNENSFTRIGAGKLFEVQDTNVRTVGNGMVLRAGVAQGVRIVQNFGKPCPAVAIDPKVSPFFGSQNLDRTILEMCGNREPQSAKQWDNLRQLLLDVRVEIIDQRHRTLSIRSFTETDARNTRFNLNGEQISVFDYYRQVRDITLKKPEWRVIISNKPVAPGETPEYVPIELCFVMPDQRVPLEKMDKNLSAKLLQANSILPAARMQKTLEHANAMKLFVENAVFSAFGIRVLGNSNNVDIGVRANPRINFAGDQPVNVNPREVEWKRASSGLRFYETFKITKWIVLCHDEHRGDVREFVKAFMNGAGRRGLVFAQDPTLPQFTGGNWEEIFAKCYEMQIEFVMLIDPLVNDTHGILKYYEAKYKVLTQHVSHERACDIIRDRRKMQTLENILNKTNCKAYGINYVPVFEESGSRFALEQNKVLVLGYDVANPPEMTKYEQRLAQSVNIELQSFDPSVVGITANMGTHPHNFVGDYFYQLARRDFLDVDQLAARIKWVLETLARNRPHAASPPYIFVLRNGLSEGQFAASVEKEMSALREGCRLYDESYKPKFIYVVGTKRHYKKFFAQRERVENLTPGSVVASKFVREDCPEFFMMSHFPLKGVGKAVEYNVLLDEIEISQDELQAVLNSLCYTHQIVNSAVSLPEPIYQADELAKRGRNNYITMKRLEEQLIPRVGDHRLVDPAVLTEMISYKDSEMNSTRFTA